MAALQKQIDSLQLENKYLRQSKLTLIKATSAEIERLRQFINVLANALRGKGFSAANIRDLQNTASTLTQSRSSRKNNQNNKPPKREWAYKQKEKEREQIKASNIAKQSKPMISSLLNESEQKTESKPLSLKERMNALKATSNNATSSNAKIEQLKAERNLTSVKVTTTSKDNIAALFADKIQKQKENNSASTMTSSKGKILKEALKNPKPENAAKVIDDLGLFVPMEKVPKFGKNKNEKSKQEIGKNESESLQKEVLNMNNNAMMKKMTESEKENMQNLICEALIKNDELKQVQMCNADVNDAFLTKILEKLAKNEHNLTELWLESNPIGDDGMKSLAEFITKDEKIQIVKLYNNKKTISTQVLNQLLDALSKNMTITKFVFDGFRFQHQKDRKEKYLRRNAEIARRKRNEEKKRLKEMQN